MEKKSPEHRKKPGLPRSIKKGKKTTAQLQMYICHKHYESIVRESLSKHHRRRVPKKLKNKQGSERIARVWIISSVWLNSTKKKVATNGEIFMLFDLIKAYDTVPVQKLWRILEKSRINNTAITTIKQLYEQHRGSNSEITYRKAFQSRKAFDKVAASLPHYLKYT